MLNFFLQANLDAVFDFIFTEPSKCLLKNEIETFEKVNCSFYFQEITLVSLYLTPIHYSILRMFVPDLEDLVNTYYGANVGVLKASVSRSRAKTTLN